MPPVTAIVSSELGPYVQAYEGFENAIGGRSNVQRKSPSAAELSESTRFVVAFGGRAASLDFGNKVTLVYCLSPTTSIDRVHKTVKIQMTPSPEILAYTLHRLQPKLRRLGVLFMAGSYEGYVRQLSQSAKLLGIDVAYQKVEELDNLPDHLRGLKKETDALWIPPDPQILSADNVEILKEFCAMNHIPLYTSLLGLVEKGATAGIAPSYRQIGKTAASVLQKLQRGEVVPAEVFSEQIDIMVDKPLALSFGLQVPQDAIDVREAAP